MKRHIIILACATLLFASGVQAKDYILALSPMQSAKTLQRQINAVIRFLAENVKPGEKALIVDGLHMKVIAQFRVKNKKIYNNPKAKIQLNRKAVKALQLFGLNPVTIAEHQQAAVMQVPQLLEFLGSNYGKFEETDIIIISNPLYVDARDPNWGMLNKQYPTDGHFSVAPHESPFSLRGKAKLLVNTRVHWVYPDNDWISSEEYRVRLTRFWHLLVEGYGSQLSTFTGDMTTMWDRAARGAKAAPHGYQRRDTEKPETIQLIDRPQSKKQVPIYDRKLTQVAPTRKALRQAQHVEIGVSWDCEQCDLDLYVRPHHGAEVLYYGHRQTQLGYYHKDFTRSPKTDGGYETVTFTSTVDLRDVLIAINWYGGRSKQGVKGEIRLAMNGQTYGLPFAFSAQAGNRSGGKDKTIASRRPANGNWLVIHPKDIVGL